ncbi:N-methyl-L-tryptophan oxidase [Alicyclobacillus dauci]|uniref:N-methyl-L-tryptophan oxidase n=1 Tax=Alicyclobacillus dauci TaxID=1475485 RepID=A0ABY6YXM7_9BACL|nr:N-methyl-L-tryptophan oxidase [Alicyclobacillus dauci]WAH35245.1 N-methyl-L-tryptophan oxidase [Alicyclobacillus dauci]
MLYDTIVLGAGSMGLPTAYQLALRGQKVLLLDQHDVPHVWGSHHGTTRMLRVAYTEGASYVPMAQRARKLWLELEENPVGPSERIFSPVGVVSVLRPTSQNNEIESSIKQYNIPHERLSADEAHKRWPGLFVPDGHIVYFDPQGGVVFSEAALRKYKALAQQAGVDFKVIGELEDISLQNHAVSVRFAGATYAAENLVITTGAATRNILKQWFPEWGVPLQPLRKVVGWYGVKRSSNNPYAAEEFPAYSIESDTGWYYGFPDFGDGVKVGRHDGGEPCDPATLDRTIEVGSPEELDLRKFVQHYLPQTTGSMSSGKVCMYNMTPDEHFVIDKHPQHSNIVLASGFSGHGFKFASVIGEIVSDLVIGGKSTFDLSLFRSNRFS